LLIRLVPNTQNLANGTDSDEEGREDGGGQDGQEEVEEDEKHEALLLMMIDNPIAATSYPPKCAPCESNRSDRNIPQRMEPWRHPNCKAHVRDDNNSGVNELANIRAALACPVMLSVVGCSSPPFTSAHPNNAKPTPTQPLQRKQKTNTEHQHGELSRLRLIKRKLKAQRALEAQRERQAEVAEGAARVPGIHISLGYEIWELAR